MADRTNSKKQNASDSANAGNCRRKFLRFFPKGFADEKYINWERGYKWKAHEQWNEELNRKTFSRLLKDENFSEISARAVRLESRTNLLFSFEKMALRDAIKTSEGARLFAEGLYEFIYGAGKTEKKFERWCATIESLPRKQTRVFNWTVVTVFGFIALPETHIFLKPNVTRTAARGYGFDFEYGSRPSWNVYVNLLEFADVIRNDLADLKPRDLIDIQSFIWVLGSTEYD